MLFQAAESDLARSNGWCVRLRTIAAEIDCASASEKYSRTTTAERRARDRLGRLHQQLQVHLDFPTWTGRS